MIFGKHINRYYLRFLPLILLGLLALVVVDYLQLEIPGLYQMVINGINTGFVDGVAFDVSFLVDKICMPMVGVILAYREKSLLTVSVAASAAVMLTEWLMAFFA